MDLSTGVISVIINGSNPENPILQILTLKRIPSGAQERYRLLVSDGQYSSSFAMLATQLNNRVTSGEIKDNCIIQLKRYICNTVQESKKVLIILDLDVLQSGEEVGRKIGDPVNYDPNKRPQQQQSPAQPPRSNYTNTTSVAQRNIPNSVSSPNHPPGVGSVIPIAQVTPYANKWTIRARVTNKSDIKTWSNSKGEGKLFSFELLDESGEIRVTAFKEQCDKFYDMVELDKIFYINGGTLKMANKQYTSVKNDYEMTLNHNSQIILCHERTSIPTMQFEFVTIEQIESINKDTMIDIIGVCKETADVATVTQRTTGRELKKRDIQLVDQSNKQIQLTMWGEKAENFDGSLQPVVAVKGARISDFNGKSLSLIISSTMSLNPDIPEAHKLKGWFESVGSTIDTVNLSGGRSGSGAMTNFKTFGDVKAENLGSGEAPDYYSVKGTVAMIRKENCLYSACPEAQCNKKVVDMNNGMYRCEKCNKEYDNFKWRLLLSVNIADVTDNQWVTAFQDSGEIILGTTAEELGSLRDNNPDAFQTLLTEVTFRDFNLKCRVKMETYNDESRLKTIVMNAAPVEPREYNRRLITEIKQLAGQV